MNKSKRYVFIAVIVAAMLFVVGGRAAPVGAHNAGVASPAATSTPFAQPDSPEAKAFLDAELGKLAVEIKHTELNHLRYVEYKYSLDFGNFTADNSSQMATVSVIEEHDVIEEISMELDPEDPFVSHRYGLEHTIVLRNEQGQWKIDSDYYNDYLWRMLRQTGKSTDEILRKIDIMLDDLEERASPTE